MKHLTIIRHAKSSWTEDGLDDFDRPLNDRGKEAIPVVGQFLKEKKLRPDLIITSPAKRALATAKGIAKIIGYPVEKFKLEESIYYGDTQSVFGLIQSIGQKYNDVFLFGHEPKLSGVIALFTGDHLEKFPTCSAYRISFDIKDWSDIKPKSGKCEFFVNPKLLGQK